MRAKNVCGAPGGAFSLGSLAGGTVQTSLAVIVLKELKGFVFMASLTSVLALSSLQDAVEGLRGARVWFATRTGIGIVAGAVAGVSSSIGRVFKLVSSHGYAIELEFPSRGTPHHSHEFLHEQSHGVAFTFIGLWKPARPFLKPCAEP